MKKHKLNQNRLGLRCGSVLAAICFAAAALQAQDATKSSDPQMTTPSQNTAPNDKTSHQAKEFIKDAADRNAYVLAMANVAQDKAQNADVKKLAQDVRTERQQAGEQLQTVASARNITTDQSLGWISQHEVNSLQKTDASKFDQEYVKGLLKDEVKDIKAYQTAADEIQESDVKSFAQTRLTKMRDCLQRTETAARTVGLDDSTISSITRTVAYQNNTDRNQSLTVNQPPAQP
jgi:putative membrane protein